VHDVFHVSQLKKCLRVLEEQIPMEELDAKEDLSYREYLVKILEMTPSVTQNKRVKMCKVQWSHHIEGDYMEKRRRVEGRISMFLFRSIRILGMRFILRGGGVGF
jgi:hypothetical protein